ncbi:substrate-binding periplasmic protein [Undibacterium sp. Dicai25W]|uniref:substrate-binding periplasmic protein n=1 Tax=Undibacterium sp. Dicai25W TaxID=3413034 RepID=UPI003BF2EFCA
MKPLSVFKYSLISLLGLLALQSSAASPVALFTLIWPPYSFENTQKSAGGISIDIAKELLLRNGNKATSISVVPWARALNVSKKQANSCIVPIARTPERETSYRWIGPIGQSTWAFFARTEDHLSFSDIQDARPYRIGMVRNDLSTEYLKEKNQFTLDSAPSDELNIKKLKAKHIDLWSTGYLTGMTQLRENKITDVEPIFVFLRVDLYIGCQIDMPQSEVATLNESLKKMYVDGTIRDIYLRYGYEKEALSMRDLPK